MSMYKDLSEFLTDLDKRKLLARVADAVSPDLEIAAVTDRACKSPDGGPALLFEKPAGFDMPVASNVFGSLERMCLALGVKQLDDLAHEIDELMTPPQPKGLFDALKLAPLVSRLSDLLPKTVKDAPCQEVVRKDGSLDEIPILTCWPEDGGRFITLPLVFTKDPETGTRNIGTYRMQVFDGRTTGMHWQRHKGGAQHHRVAERLGRRLDVAVALSPEPVLTYCATAPMPEGLDELLLGGFLARKRIEMVRCVTVDLDVPASSHIVLEGYVEPGERRREGPFGDHTGLYSQPDDFPVFHLTCVTQRKRPTYLTTVVGVPPMEDYYLGLASERIFLPMIRKTLPEIVDMHFPAEGIFHNLVIIAVDIGLDEIAWPVDRAVDMRLRRQVQHRVGFERAQHFVQQRAVANITALKPVTGMVLDRLQRGEVGGIGKLVEVENCLVEFANQEPAHRRPDKPGAAGHQNFHAFSHRTTPARAGSGSAGATSL